MKTTQLYFQTKKDLVRIRNQEKRIKNNIFLIGLLIILAIACSSNPIVGIAAIIYFATISILWDERPWLKIVKYGDISDLEVEYELTRQVNQNTQNIYEYSAITDDLYGQLDYQDVKKKLDTKEAILCVDEKTLECIREITEINHTLKIESGQKIIDQEEAMIGEIELVKKHIAELRMNGNQYSYFEKLGVSPSFFSIVKSGLTFNY